MNNNITKEVISFNDLEKNIFNFVCFIGRFLTECILAKEDLILHKEIKKKYRNKGYATTVIKTVYGEVKYKRHKYIKINEEGKEIVITPLDERLKVEKIGLVSKNLADKIVEIATENSFRDTSEIVNKTTNANVSHQVCWKVVQEVGESIKADEENMLNRMYANELKPDKEVKVLFEEEDGVWLKMQGKKHQKMPKQELKVGTIYEGITKDKKRRKLVNKRVFAGFEDSDTFHEKRESQVRSIYNVKRIEKRLLNGDGATWIKDQYTNDKIYQLDPFHVNQAIKKNIAIDKEVAKEVTKLYKQCKIDEMLKYINTYIDSVETDNKFDTRSLKAKELYTYLFNNKEYLVPYKKRIIDLPKPPEGISYNNMGVQENQNCTVITMRMCGGRKRWSVDGGNHMAKILYTKENNELQKAIDETPIQVDIKDIILNGLEVFSAGKIPTTIGSGSKYIETMNAHVMLRDVARTDSLNAFLDACF